MSKDKIEAVTLEEFDLLGIELDGSIDSLIETLERIRADGVKRGLSNIYCRTEMVDEPVYDDEDGEYRGNVVHKMTMKITGAAPENCKTSADVLAAAKTWL